MHKKYDINEEIVKLKFTKYLTLVLLAITILFLVILFVKEGFPVW